MRIGVDVNMHDVQDAIEPIPAGTYSVRVSDADVRATKGDAAKSAQLIHLEYTVVEGEHANRKVFDNVGLSKEAAWRLKRLLNATKVPYSVNGSRTEFDLDDLKGALLSVVVSQRTYENRVQNKVQDYVIPA